MRRWGRLRQPPRLRPRPGLSRGGRLRGASLAPPPDLAEHVSVGGLERSPKFDGVAPLCVSVGVSAASPRELLSPGVVAAGVVPEIACKPVDAAKAAEEVTSAGALLDYLGDNAHQVSAAEFEERLKRDPEVLDADEKVQLAFKVGRDATLFTTKRILIIDVRGWSGKKIAYRSVLWKSVRAFGVESAGGMLDRDAEVFLWTSISEMRVVRQDLRKDKADLMAVNRFISNMVLGNDTVEAAPSAVSAAGEVDSGSTSLFEWAGDDQRQIDEKKLDAQFHSSPAILQNCEHVEMAFKGRRDMTLFTTKRLIIVDLKGWSGKKVKYSSVPWITVQAFGVRSAGSFMDKDSEMVIYTDIMHEPKTGDDPPKAGMAMLEQDFSKDKVDLMAIHRYLSAKCVHVGQHSAAIDVTPVPPEVLAAGPPNGPENLLNWLGGDASQIDPSEFQAQLSKASMLQSGESVVMAFKVGRDTMAFTDRRVFKVDVQGWSGKKVLYLSIPYTSLRGFSVASAGSWDRDAEVMLLMRSYWMPQVTMDLRKGKADLTAVNRFLGAQLFGTYAGVGSAVPQAPADASGGVGGFLDWLGDDTRAIDPQEVDRRLHTEPAILFDDEAVDTALKCGRDMWVFTNKRILAVDVKGLSGKRVYNTVQYTTAPLKYCVGCRVQTAGMLDRDSEGAVFVDACGAPGVGIDMRKDKVDVFALNHTLVAKVLSRSQGRREEPFSLPESPSATAGQRR